MKKHPLYLLTLCLMTSACGSSIGDGTPCSRRIDLPPPSAPANPTNTAVPSTMMNLTWDDPRKTENVTESGTDRCSGMNCSSTRYQSGITETTFSKTELAPDSRSRYAVSALDTAVNQSFLSAIDELTTPAVPATQTYTLIGAGDIASAANNSGAESTAKLLDAAVAADSNTIVFTAGDNVHPCGSASEYSTYYDPTWGRHKARTRPSPGNHDYETSGALGYFNYFCPNSANCSFPSGTKPPYYSYDLGNWHLISLNSEQINSSQLTWLQDDLAVHSDSCILAYWHRPRFTSGTGAGSQLDVQPFWDVLYAAKADVVVNGHEHSYERFAKMSASGSADPNGIRQFVVGTGGIVNVGFGSIMPNSEVRLANIQGVIKLSLHNEGYDWTFVPSTSTNLGDSGSDICNK